MLKNTILTLQSNQSLTIGFIKTWILENKDSFNDTIEKTECYKWKRWQSDKSTHVFPCVCVTRNMECIYIETYRALEKLIEAINSEEFYNHLLQQYSKIKNNKNAVFEWINANKEIGKELLLIKSTIQITTQSDPYQYITFDIDKTEIPKLWEFQEIFNQNYYSQEYENYSYN